MTGRFVPRCQGDGMIEETRTAKDRPELSVAVPVYNSANIFPELHRRLVGALEPAVDSFEIIAVIDGCQDNSAGVIGSLAASETPAVLYHCEQNRFWRGNDR